MTGFTTQAIHTTDRNQYGSILPPIFTTTSAAATPPARPSKPRLQPLKGLSTPLPTLPEWAPPRPPSES